MTDLPQAVQDAANKLMGALALHEDTRATLETALHDLWNQAREPDGFCPHHGEEWTDTTPEPWCHGCVDAGITSAPDTTDTPGRTATRPDLTDLARLIYAEANTLIAGAALTRTAPLHRIRRNAEQLLTALGEPADHPAATPDPDLRANLGAAIIRALDLSLNTTDPAQRAQIGDWVAKARAAQAAKDATAIRRLLAQPYATTGGAR